MVRAIDQKDPHRSLAERLGGRDAAKSSADDYNDGKLSIMVQLAFLRELTAPALS